MKLDLETLKEVEHQLNHVPENWEGTWSIETWQVFVFVLETIEEMRKEAV